MYEIMREFYEDFLKKKELIPEVIVKNSFPIVWFGNTRRFFHSKVRVVTIGLNPSDDEFPQNNPALRFPEACIAFEQGKMGRVCDSLNGYFEYNREPFWNWFIAYERALGSMPFGATYGGMKKKCLWAENYAVHIDFFSAIATNPTYSRLSKEQQNVLQNIKLFRKLFDYLTDGGEDASHVIALFSTSKEKICKEFGLNSDNRFYVKFNEKNKLVVEAYQIDKKIFIWGKPNIKPFNGVSKDILKEAMQEICRRIEVK